jgi:hypothetical protein
LGLLSFVERWLSEEEALPYLLHQAVAGLGGTGAMVHSVSISHLLRLPHGGVVDSGLQLAAVAGIPREAVMGWEEIGRDEAVAPACALREGGFVWRPLRMDAAGGDDPRDGSAAVRSRLSRFVPGEGGLAAVPLMACNPAVDEPQTIGPTGQPLGSLSI